MMRYPFSSSPASRTSGSALPTGGNPRRPPARFGLWRRGCLPILLVFLIAIALGAGYVFYALNRPVPSIPQVAVLQPRPETPVVAGDISLILAAASDPDGVAEVEFWVNGQRLGTQINPDPQPGTAFRASQIWRPSGPGSYLLFVRARDTKGYYGQARPLVLEVIPKAAAGPQQYLVTAGDTVEAIATRFGTTPDEVRNLNPDLAEREPTPGESLLLPPPSGEDGAEEEPEIPEVAPAPGSGTPSGGGVPGGGAPGGGAPGEEPPGGGAPGGGPGGAPGGGVPGGGAPGGGAPGEGPPGGGAPGGGSETPSEPLPPSGEDRGAGNRLGDWVENLLGHEARCRLFPGACDDPAGIWRWSGDGAPWWWADNQGRIPEAPGESRFFGAGKCRVEVRWMDRSDNEDGFYLFRRNLAEMRPEPFVEAVLAGTILPAATVGPHEGTGWVSFVDTPVEGYYEYYVAAFNRTGMSAPVPLGTGFVPCPLLFNGEAMAAPRSFHFTMGVKTAEALVTAAEPIEDLYCYISLAGMPYERVPYEGVRMVPEDRSDEEGFRQWVQRDRRLIYWLSGHVALKPGQAYPVNVECLAWWQGELRFLNSGRPATGTITPDPERAVSGRIVAESGEFYLWYEIDSPRLLGMVPVDPSIPRPTDLAFVNCGESGDDRCRALGRYNGWVLFWRWPVPDEMVPEPPTFFINPPGSSWDRYALPLGAALSPPAIRRIGRDLYAYPIATCLSERGPFSVSAVARGGTASPWSELIWLPAAGCPAIEISFEELRVHRVDDGRSLGLVGEKDLTMEAYGWSEIVWRSREEGAAWAVTWVEVVWNRRGWNDMDRPYYSPGDEVPDTTAIKAREEPYFWRDFYLYWRSRRSEDLVTGRDEEERRYGGHVRRGFGRNQNTVRISILEGHRLYIASHLWDYDEASGNDVWCRPWTELPGKSVEEWLATDEMLTLHDVQEDQGECTVTVRVRGVFVEGED